MAQQVHKQWLAVLYHWRMAKNKWLHEKNRTKYKKGRVKIKGPLNDWGIINPNQEARCFLVLLFSISN